jgi:AbrB family looped-hinge helix DNA binding protein
MKITVSTNGQMILPAEIRRQDDIRAGQQFTMERIARGQYRLTRKEHRANAGLVDWLLSCPGKGFFTPLESESTESL